MNYVFIVLLAALSACAPASHSSTPNPTENPITEPPITDPGTDDPVTNPDAYPQVISGWLDAYSNFVEAKVSDVYPALLGIGAARMTTVCPKWSALDRESRERFWSGLLYAIAGPESGRNRTAVFRETGLSTDSVTGLQIRSEGLLQLSYVDVVNYRYPGGDISWEHDRAMAYADYAAARSSGNPERTILNAYSNLNLGLFIMNRLTGNYPSEKLETTLGKYWSTMRPANSTFAKVMTGLKSKMPACF